MKKAIFILVVIGSSLFYYAGALTQKEFPFLKESFSAPTRGWKMMSPVSKEEIDQFYQLKLDQGLRNVPVLSLALIREAERARKGGDPAKAVEIAQDSVKPFPDPTEPYFQLTRERFYQNPYQFPKIISEVYRGLRSTL